MGRRKKLEEKQLITTAASSSSSNSNSSNSMMSVHESSGGVSGDVSGCSDCLKAQGILPVRKATRPWRKKPSARAGTPVVVHLKDTIKVSIKGKMRSSPVSSDHESDNSSDDSIPSHKCLERKQRQLGASGGGSRYLKHSGIHRRGRDKNFNAFLSAIEKVHFKENTHVAANLDHLNAQQQQQQHQQQQQQHPRQFTQTSKHEAGPYLLNNSVHVHGSGSFIKRSTFSKPEPTPYLNKKRNIDLICNDLHSERASTGSPCSSSGRSEDTDFAETSSDVSGTETPTEWDLSSGSDFEELSKEELADLTEYTTGYALTKYSCLPHDCPQCLSTYYSHIHVNYDSQDSDWFRVEIVDGNGEVTGDFKQNQDDNNDDVRNTVVIDCPVKITGQGKVEVSLANLFNHPDPNPTASSSSSSSASSSGSRRATSSSYTNPNAVLVDLTDSEISFSISNHAPVPSAQPPPPFYPDLYQNFYYTMFGYVPHFVPYYLVPPPTYYNPYAMVSVPRPLCLPRDLQCLNSRRLCMVPAYEVENCKPPSFLSFFPPYLSV